ncbi:hypothetical protein J6590_011984 [Homalodisca vitripennis]|nr:hypothetical protein J6590_011984 [Homalodisca vitripennis]
MRAVVKYANFEGRRHKSWAKVTAPRPGDKLHNNNTINKTNRRNRCENKTGNGAPSRGTGRVVTGGATRGIRSP